MKPQVLIFTIFIAAVIADDPDVERCKRYAKKIISNCARDSGFAKDYKDVQNFCEEENGDAFSRCIQSEVDQFKQSPSIVKRDCIEECENSRDPGCRFLNCWKEEKCLQEGALD